jgi:AhpC/TSA family
MTKKMVSMIVVCLLVIKVSAQEYFKVEFDAFTPPIKDMINAVEDKPAKNFMMQDLDGQSVTLSQYLGKKVVLWFWDTDSASMAINNGLDLIAKKNPQAVFLSLFNPKKEDLPTSSNQKTFIILPNAAFLGEAVYDKELGTPRIYLINEAGIAKMVMPLSYLNDFNQVTTLINSFLLNKIY